MQTDADLARETASLIADWCERYTPQAAWDNAEMLLAQIADPEYQAKGYTWLDSEYDAWKTEQLIQGYLKQRKKLPFHPLYTLGYTGLSYYHIHHYLKETGALLADIRFSPHSRHPQWDEQSLEAEFPRHYLRLRSFGNPNYANGKPIKLWKPKEGLPLVEWTLKDRPLILLCACKEVETCHRKLAAEWLAKRLKGAEMTHLGMAPTQLNLLAIA